MVEANSSRTAVGMVDDSDSPVEILCLVRDFEPAVHDGVDLDLQRVADELVIIRHEGNVVSRVLKLRRLPVLLETDLVSVGINVPVGGERSRRNDIIREDIFPDGPSLHGK